jgi:hypothetical protein
VESSSSVPPSGATTVFANDGDEQELAVTKQPGAILFRIHLKGRCERIVTGTARLKHSDFGTEEDEGPDGTLETVDEFILDDRAQGVWIKVRIQSKHWAWARLVEADTNKAPCRVDEGRLMPRRRIIDPR